MNKSSLEDRMLLYEGAESDRRCLPRLPVCIRLDGKTFHSWTRGLRRPFDGQLSRLMVETTSFLVEQTSALIGYTQSDEISLVLYSSSPKSQLFLDGRVQKLVSVTASLATAFFNSRVPALLPEKEGHLAFFDSRVWAVPNLDEAANVLLWREQDATRNSVAMLAQAFFSHRELHGKTSSEMQEMLWAEHEVNWNDLEPRFKRGTFVQRAKVMTRFSAEELERLPLKHRARTQPDLEVERHMIRTLDMPPFSRVTNRVEVLLGADPVLASSGSG